jgi:GR25 family glycosyltransferase involved in LPS biosynthesis
MNDLSTGDRIDFAAYNYTLLTYATAKFIPSLHIWLDINTKHAATIRASIIVYLGQDVGEEARASLRTKYADVKWRLTPSEVPTGAFADYWAPEHYAYKVWAQKQVCDELVADPKSVVIFTDAGIVTVMMPTAMIEKAVRHGACFVDDETQKNRYWFSKAFNSLLAVKDTELDENQTLSGMQVYMPAKAKAIYESAYNMSLFRDIIAGPKWEGIHPNGQPFGHRHDQSIYSLLRIRMAVPTVDIKNTYNDKSLNDARIGMYPFYVHRGNFIVKGEPIKGISDVVVVNLKRRPDRLKEFMTNNKDIASIVGIHEAVDGRSITLTPSIARVLRPNGFFWKKGMAGCSLSHLALWHKLAVSNDKAYLVFEDDAKLLPGWHDKLTAAMGRAPANWDFMYIGGILPPNKAGLDTVREPVNEYWSRIRPNQAFGQSQPAPYYHACTYSYLVSKSGAEKMMNLIKEHDGFYLSVDHMIVNNMAYFNVYFMNPLICNCTQDEDPAYVQSQFNNYGRVDSFDSDIWNNDERWSVEEREAALKEAGPLDVKAAIMDLYSAKPTVSAKSPESEPYKYSQTPINDTMHKINLIQTENKPVVQRNLLVRAINAGPSTHDAIMEIDWLEKMLDVNIFVEPMVGSSEKFNPGEVPWIIVSRADLHQWLKVFEIFTREGRNFYAIHTSDEFGQDNISWYKSPMCKAVIRNYHRADADLPHVITMPLGYAQGTIDELTKQRAKDLTWSFEGTGWFGRAEKLAALDGIVPNHKALHPNWNSPDQKSRSEYAALIARSKFVPIVRGNHFETFRLYEALEAGSVPIYVREVGDEVYWNWLTAHIKLANIGSWATAAKYMAYFMANPAEMEKYRAGLMEQWATWKSSLRARLARII